MNNLALVSIIIPTYNRANLIGETLDSILQQTYANWECIIVDDGSTDNTEEIVSQFLEKDTRFQYQHRSKERPKGANACRNIGLETANGAFIVFFDSDDLMTPNHLEVKLHAINTYKTDYVITKTEYLDNKAKIGGNNYRFKVYPLTPFNYVSQAVNWLTYDVCIKSNIAKSIRFNELLQSGQEYNYFSKLVYVSTHAKFINKTVTLRRFHDNSIRSKLNTENKINTSAFRAKWFTYCDLRNIAEKKTRLYLLNKCMAIVYKSKTILITDKMQFVKAVFKEYHYQGIYFLLMLLQLKLFGKGYFFYQKITSSYK